VVEVHLEALAAVLEDVWQRGPLLFVTRRVVGVGYSMVFDEDYSNVCREIVN